MRQMGSILGVPCCLQATQSRSNGIFVWITFVQAAEKLAQSFLLQIP